MKRTSIAIAGMVGRVWGSLGEFRTGMECLPYVRFASLFVISFEFMSPPHVGVPRLVPRNGVTTPMFGLAAIIVGTSPLGESLSPAPPPGVLFVEQAGRHSLEGRLPAMVAQAIELLRGGRGFQALLRSVEVEGT